MLKVISNNKILSTCSLTLRSGTLCIIETDAVGLDALSILKSAPQSAHKSLTTVLWLHPGSNSKTGSLKRKSTGLNKPTGKNLRWNQWKHSYPAWISWPSWIKIFLTTPMRLVRKLFRSLSPSSWYRNTTTVLLIRVPSLTRHLTSVAFLSDDGSLTKTFSVLDSIGLYHSVTETTQSYIFDRNTRWRSITDGQSRKYYRYWTTA